MALIRNIIYISILLFMILTLSADYANIHDIKNVSKLTTCLLILAVPFVCRHESMKSYSNLLLIAISLMAIFGVIILNPQQFLQGLFLLGTANLIMARAFITFKGYTFNTWLLLALILGNTLLGVMIYRAQGDISLILVLYFLTSIFMVWQGGNLYFLNRSFGNLLILLGLVCFIISNLFYSVFQYFDHRHVYDSLALFFFWVFLLFIVHSSTLPEKKFR